jgi:hypothetical protein
LRDDRRPHDRAEQFFLGSEIEVDRPLRDAGAQRDVVEFGRCEPVVGE